MSKVAQLFVWVVMLSCLSGFVLSQEKPPTIEERREAEKAWEALVRVKGGREKLHSVTNLLVEMWPNKAEKYRFNRLWVFPDRLWEFSYDIFGEDPFVNVLDASKNKVIIADKSKIIDESTLEGYKRWWPHYEVLLLLETKWFKPELIRVTSKKVGKKTYDTIQTVVNDDRMDFTYEQEDMLVTQIDDFYKGEIAESHSFDQYIDLNGVKIAQKWGQKDVVLGDHRFRYPPVKISVNVEYDPDLFTGSPRATTSDAWKRTR